MGLLHLLYFLAVLIHEATWVLAGRDICELDNHLSITGGHKVSIKEIPFMVSISNEVTSDIENQYEFCCGGTIIHKRFILTAASCCTKFDTTNITVVGMSSPSLGNPGRLLDYVEEIFIHHYYDKETLVNDICLLKTNLDVPLSWLVKASLPEKDFVLEEGTLVNVTGWGAIASNLGIEEDLRQVTVPVLSQECCDEEYEVFNDDQICAGAWDRDFCRGDVGGPLTINNMLVGIISGEGECGKHPGCYTRVSSYLDWIDSTINKNL